MLSTLYPLGYSVCLLGLILWFYFEENRVMSRMMSTAFLGGFLVYLFALAFSDGSTSYKLAILFRDFMVLAAVTSGFSFLKKQKMLFFALLAVVYCIFQFKYFSVLQQTFPETPNEQVALPSPDHSTELEKALTQPSHSDPEGELLVEIKENHQMQELAHLVKKYGLSYSPAFEVALKDQTDLDDYVVLNIPKKAIHQSQAITRDLMASGLIDSWEWNEIVQLDPQELAPIGSQRKNVKKYGLNDPDIDQLWGFEALKMDELYKVLKSSKVKAKRKARVFILDTGVDAKHEDLKANYRSHKAKYDKDPRGHGTHCAGIAGAVSNNGKGVASFSQSNDYVQLTSITVLRAFGGGTQQGIINGMIEAADNGADVISMSLGGPSNDAKQRAYQKAIEYANKAGAIVIVAAGNSNANAKFFAPACAPGAITVSAVDTMINRASFSNFVTNLKMGIAAPGVDIHSTIPSSKYAKFSGTSMATPYVAGLVGLMKSIQPELTTKEVYSILNKTGVKTGNTKETGRMIQPAAAIKALQ
ncbi:MAG: S8 family serine peptidase [Bacteroidota bacterium]